MSLPELDRLDVRPGATHVRFMVSAWLAVMAAQAYLCRLSLSVAASSVRSDLGLTEDQIGLIMGPAFFWAYALAQIPSSRLGEIWGARIALPCFVTVWSLATAAFGIVSWYPLLVGVWIAAGLAQAGAFPVATRSIAIWFPRTERALASGVLVAMMSAGAAFAAGVTGTLIQRWGWQTLFALYAVPGIAWAMGFAFWFRNRPENHPAVNAEELRQIQSGQSEAALGSTGHEPVPWRHLLTSWSLWMICGQQFCRAAAMVFFGTWFPTFLRESRQITLVNSGLLSILPHLAIAVAGLIGGTIADAVLRRTGRLDWSRKGLAVSSLILSTALIFVSYSVRETTLAVLVISAGIFFAGLAGPAAYAITMDLGGKHAGAVFATMNMAGNIGAGLFPLLVPVLRRKVESVPILMQASLDDSWNAIVALVAALHLAAAACWMLLPLGKPLSGRQDQ